MAHETFVNELGNKIAMRVETDGHEFLLECAGPRGRIGHRWTRKEALKVHQLLEAALCL